MPLVQQTLMQTAAVHSRQRPEISEKLGGAAVAHQPGALLANHGAIVSPQLDHVVAPRRALQLKCSQRLCDGLWTCFLPPALRLGHRIQHRRQLDRVLHTIHPAFCV